MLVQCRYLSYAGVSKIEPRRLCLDIRQPLKTKVISQHDVEKKERKKKKKERKRDKKGKVYVKQKIYRVMGTCFWNVQLMVSFLHKAIFFSKSESDQKIYTHDYWEITWLKFCLVFKIFVLKHYCWELFHCLTDFIMKMFVRILKIICFFFLT